MLLKKAAFVAHLRIIEMPPDLSMENEPWYKNQWVWLIIAIPSLTVIGCMITIYLALSHPDYLVSDTAIKEETPATQSR